MSTDIDKNITISSRKNQMRLLKDVRDIIKNPLIDQGIYYIHSTDNMYRGYALIFGPDDTIYKYGSYLFKFKFSNNYPYEPPKLTYCTNDGKTRFNPNLYRSGKVCISILNTWKGEQWTSCQTIRSVLLTLITLLHNKPLLNEPGLTEKHRAFIPYNKIIRYKNFEIAINNSLNKHLLINKFISFYCFIKKHLVDKKDKIIEELQQLANSDINNEEVYCSVYNMRVATDYKKVLNDFQNLINNIN